VCAQFAPEGCPGKPQENAAGASAAEPVAGWRVAEERAAEIFDHGHLARLSCGNIALEREVLRLFCAHLPMSLERLRACHGRPFREAAHTIKGSAAAIGAWRLARAAERAEGSDGGPPAARTAAITAVCAAAAEASRHIGWHIGWHIGRHVVRQAGRER
jgi:hypothetical protein